MIGRIFSSLPTFKELEFEPGLNLVVVKREGSSTERQTRNRAGKTSLIEIIHFLHGSKCDKKAIFKADELIEHNFGMELSINSKTYQIERSGKKPSKIQVSSGDTSSWPHKPKLDKKLGVDVISNENWKDILGQLMFGITNAAEDEDETGALSFRSLFSYFVRRQNSGGFVEPSRAFEQQKPGDQQVNLLYLLGFDHSIGQDWQKVRNREKTIKELRGASDDGALKEIIGATAALRTKLAIAEERLKHLAEALSSFKVLPEYERYEQEASSITRQLGELSDQETVDKQILGDLEQSINEEKEPELNDVSRMYSELGVAFSPSAVKRLQDVEEFHRSVVRNRRSYLQEEMTAVRKRMADRKTKVSDLDNRRAQIMNLLKSHGALDQFSKLQEQYAASKAEVEHMKKQFDLAEKIESESAQMTSERNALLAELKHEFKEKETILQEAIVTFESISSALYESPGELIVSETTNGPKFDIHIQGSRSRGIRNMQIFCFDLMLIKLCRKRGIGPDFIVHDSHIFDGVDDRQIAKALELGARFAHELGIQYIVTLNSDVLDSVQPNFAPAFNPADYMVDVDLSDQSDSGGLFGIRFE